MSSPTTEKLDRNRNILLHLQNPPKGSLNKQLCEIGSRLGCQISLFQTSRRELGMPLQCSRNQDTLQLKQLLNNLTLGIQHIQLSLPKLPRHFDNPLPLQLRPVVEKGRPRNARTPDDIFFTHINIFMFNQKIYYGKNRVLPQKLHQQ